MKLSKAQRAFLSILAQSKTTVPRKRLPLADRAEDKVRQSCRRNGWAIFGRRLSDKVNGWRITSRGRAALEDEK